MNAAPGRASATTRSRAIAGLGVGAAFLVVGCAQILGIEPLQESDDDEVACTPATVSECPAAPGGSACLTAVCTTDGLCALAVSPPGTPVASQLAGDCRAVVCQADGSAAEQPDVADLPNDGNPCTAEACTNDGEVDTNFVPAGSPCPEGVCNGAGACVECVETADCVAVGEVCDATFCVPSGCTNAVVDGEESDVDCGGPACAPCADGLACRDPSDCLSEVCSTVDGAKVCGTPGCGDLVRNGDETDVDCGGGTCAPCADGLACMSATDCASSVCECTGSNCVLLCKAPRCDDGVQNGTEVVADCGPSCPFACDPGEPCAANGWCSSKLCDVPGNACLAPTCSDGVKNQDEQQPDCGGSSCPPC